MHREEQLTNIFLLPTIMFNDTARDLLLKIGSEVLLDELVLALGKAFEFNFSIGLILGDNFTVRFPRP